MGTIIVILGIAIVITCFIHIWVDNLAMKKVIGKEDKPKYILDMENELMQVDIALGNSMKALRDDISRVVARELPKVVATGKNNLNVYLLYKHKYGNLEAPSVRITEAQYNLIERHKSDTKWVDSQLLAGSLSQYVMVYYVSVDYRWNTNEGIMLNISLKEV